MHINPRDYRYIRLEEYPDPEMMIESDQLIFKVGLIVVGIALVALSLVLARVVLG